MKTFVLLLVVLFSSNALALDNQRIYNNVSQIAALTFLYADWKTTRELGKYYHTQNPNNGKIYHEKGMLGLFGNQPSQGETNLYFGTMVLINLSINYWGTDTVKSFFNTIQFSIHYDAYHNNISIGLSSAF